MPNSTTERDELDIPDLSETHALIDVPEFGKVWVVKDIAAYYDRMEAYCNARVKTVCEEVIGEDTKHSHPTRVYCEDCRDRDHENALREEQRTRLEAALSAKDNQRKEDV